MARQEVQPAPVTEMRILAGLALQPIVTAVFAFLLFPLLLLDRTGQTFAGGRPGGGSAGSGGSDAAASVAFAVALVSVPLMLMGALPTLLWLRRRGALTLSRSLAGGVVFGNLPIVVGHLLAGGYGPMQTARTVVYASAIGLAGAAVFWLVICPTHRKPAA